MAQVKLKVPANVSAVSHEGDEIEVMDGHVWVSERQAKVLMESHGFTLPGERRDGDDDPAGEDADEMDPATMNKDELKAFLRGEDVAIPKGSTVGDLRSLVAEHLASKSEE